MTKVDLPEPSVGPLSRVAPKPVRFVLNWGRRYSLWVFNFGLACCAIEFISTSMSRHDFIRFGVIPFAPGPRQADLMVVSGTVSDKMAPAVKRLYEQMPEPKYVISFGACSNCGGPYWDSYCVTKGVDQIVPVDVYVPGCPPRPEALIHGIVRLQEKIASEALGERYTNGGEAVAPPPTRVPAKALRRPLRIPPPPPAELAAAEQATTLFPAVDGRTEQFAQVDATVELPAAEAPGSKKRDTGKPPVVREAAAEPENATEELPVSEATQTLPVLAEPVPEPPEEEPKRTARRPGALKRFAEGPPDDAPTDPGIIPGLTDD